MKITFFAGQFPLLSESFVVQHITSLLDLGHDVNIVSYSQPNQIEVQEEVLQYNLLEKTTYVALPKSKSRQRIKGFLWLLSSFFRTPSKTVRLLNIFWKEKVFSYQGLFLFYLIHQTKPDILHAHFGPNALPLLWLKKACPNIKLITTFHGYDVSVFVRQKGEHVYDELFAQGDIFTYNSEATKQKLLNLGCPSQRMVKLPMGINVEKIPFKKRDYQSPNPIRLLSVGRLVEMKGREYAIKAIAKLKDQYPIQYDIVGDGPLRDELQQLIHGLNADATITLHGWVSSSRLKQFYENAHIFLHPSVTSSDGNQEGQGVVLLEAQAYGIPIVATRHGAFPDSIIDSKTGFLVPEKDINSLAATIKQLILNSPQWPEIGSHGRDYVTQSFASNTLSKRLESIYTETLNSATH